MAIYISGVKNLPEQVQKNKDDIEDLKQDSATKTELQAVADDVDALEGRMDTAEGDIDALETKTQQITYDSVNNRENFSGDVEIDGNVLVNSMQNKDNYGAITLPNQANDDVVIINASGGTAHFLKYDKDGNLEIDGNVLVNSMQNKDGYGAITLPNQANDDIVIINASGGTAHILRFDKDGKLTIDGNEVGGKKFYQHHMALAMGLAYQYVILDIITDSPTPMTKNDLANYFNTKGYVNQASAFLITAYIYINADYRFMRELYATNSTTLIGLIYDAAGGNQQALTCTSITDQVLPI